MWLGVCADHCVWLGVCAGLCVCDAHQVKIMHHSDLLGPPGPQVCSFPVPVWSSQVQREDISVSWQMRCSHALCLQQSSPGGGVSESEGGALAPFSAWGVRTLWKSH